jgi:hypothetical protein
MGKLNRVYRRTEAGIKAWLDQDPALSDEHRKILGLIDDGTHWDVIRTLLRRHADYQRLADLEEQGLIVSQAGTAEHDLDFTGSFAFAKRA